MIEDDEPTQALRNVSRLLEKPDRIQQARQLWIEFMDDEFRRDSLKLVWHLAWAIGACLLFWYGVYRLSGGSK